MHGAVVEAIVVIVGFLGVGKTTLLKKIVKDFIEKSWDPFIILNDYENANMDSQHFLSFLKPDQINALSGSCICCSGLNELRVQVNNIKKRDKGITLIEANGTTDAISLMGFLGVGVSEHFLPPVQVVVVDVRHWQKRDHHNELEASQVQVASLIVLNFTNDAPIERVIEVEQSLRDFNPIAKIVHWDKLNINSLAELDPNNVEAKKIDHHIFHWASCSVDLEDPMKSKDIKEVIRKIPSHILRVKGCTRLDDDDFYSYFERVPSGETYIRPFYSKLVTGPKLLAIGPGSDPKLISSIIDEAQKR